ncbi:MAG: FAD-dependent oxidoreductase [Deltaproteobacteria bacterium]|nr:FAD-dependent oxidoreductase [Deltaproteobacteria bacterium]MDO9211996.1 FAD-dependent oxidoreductase [Deltaproteobacteria bacterium]
MSKISIPVVTTDVLILGAGGAGLCAALHAADAGKNIKILLVTKAIIGKGGCSRMVQGGYNVVLNPADSFAKHFQDTLKGGQFINNQDLTWELVTVAPQRIKEMETQYGCFFDRNPDGTIHQKPFAGQSFDRTVHKGDLTGIEIVSRLSEQVFRRDIEYLDEHRAVELLWDKGGTRIVGALLLEVTRGEFLIAHARTTLVATGGGPTMYKLFAPSLDKSADGIALCYRAGAEMVDMEMVQFHPTGLIVKGSNTSGTLLEEGLRGAGAQLFNVLGERFMERYAPEVKERATRDVVSRSSFMEITAGRGTPNGGVFIDASVMGPNFVKKNFPGMVERCRDYGFDLANERVEVSPTAHFFMGGARIDTRCLTDLDGLYVAGEDAGGVHGANRLGGNGIADSTVFGGIAGDSMAHDVIGRELAPFDERPVEELIKQMEAPFGREGVDLYPLRETLRLSNWEKLGIIREEKGLLEGLQIIQELQEKMNRVGVAGGKACNISWNDWLNMRNLLDVSAIVGQSALKRQESRGAHYRNDFPKKNNKEYLKNFFIKREKGETKIYERPVVLNRLKPEDIGFE